MKTLALTSAYKIQPYSFTPQPGAVGRENVTLRANHAPKPTKDHFAYPSLDSEKRKSHLRFGKKHTLRRLFYGTMLASSLFASGFMGYYSFAEIPLPKMVWHSYFGKGEPLTADFTHFDFSDITKRASFPDLDAEAKKMYNPQQSVTQEITLVFGHKLTGVNRASFGGIALKLTGPMTVHPDKTWELDGILSAARDDKFDKNFGRTAVHRNFAEDLMTYVAWLANTGEFPVHFEGSQPLVLTGKIGDDSIQHLP